jgi:DNA (cytosine-5)-methyltransferase 1
MTLTVTDLFCGAGGSSQGAEDAGTQLALGLNHWRRAIDTHATNFPHAEHDCADVSVCDPRYYPTTDLLIASPECTSHSYANGVSRKLARRSLLEVPDPAAERSRATMWDVVRFMEAHRYQAVIVENVVNVRDWELFEP